MRNFQVNQNQQISATNMMILMNICVFLITKGFPSLWIDKPLLLGNYSLLDRLMKTNVQVSRGEYQRLLTSLFCHGNSFHLFFNLFALHQIGSPFEYLLGAKHMLFIYICSGMAANYGTYIMNTSHNSLGASACIFGLYGALLAEHKYGLRVRKGVDVEYVKRQLIINIVYGLSAKNVDNAAHILGFLTGGLLQAMFPTGLDF